MWNIEHLHIEKNGAARLIDDSAVHIPVEISQKSNR